MAQAINFVVHGVAQPAGSKRAFHNAKTGRTVVVDDAKGSRSWKTTVSEAALEHLPEEPLTGPIGLTLLFYMPRPKGHYGSGRNADKLKPSAPEWPTVKPDTTKLLRGVEDALTGLLWRDDAQIVHQVASKRYGHPARCEVYLEELVPAYSADKQTEGSVR